MSVDRSFERFVADHVSGAAGQHRLPDDFYDDIQTVASRTRQRPEWLALIKEPPMRINSTVGVGSPVARIAVLLATTLLMAVLGVGALVVGAQSPSPVPDDTPPMSFFTGSAPWSADCPRATPTVETVDGIVKKRGESWGCLTWTTDDPRFSGVSEAIWNSDEVTGSAAVASGRPGSITAGRERIENEAGAWEGTSIMLSVGSEFEGEAAGWYVGEGAYDGLVAYVVITDPASGTVWGVIMPDDGFAAPAAFPVE
jgi:hypothetical protein